MAGSRRYAVTASGTLLPFLLAALGQKREAVKRLLKLGAVSVNGDVVRQFDHLLAIGDDVAVGPLQPAAAARRLERAGIVPLYEDEALIVVDKPVGLLTVATAQEKTDTLFVRLNEFLRVRSLDRPPAPGGSRAGGEKRRDVFAYVVHRLDRETSGLVLFARTEAVRRQLQADWPAVEKTYLAVVQGRPATEQGTITGYLVEDPRSLKVAAADRPGPGARLATTHYRTIESRGDRSLLEVRLETGRKHQIRVHLAGLGCPVVGDDRYGPRGSGRLRLALHASGLTFVHPQTSERLQAASPLPGGMKKLLGRA